MNRITKRSGEAGARVAGAEPSSPARRTATIDRPSNEETPIHCEPLTKAALDPTLPLATTSNVAKLRMQAAGEAPVSAPDKNLHALASELISALGPGIEAGARTRWRKKKFRRVLQEAAIPIAQDAAKRLGAMPGPIGSDQVRAAVAASVADAIGRVPSAFKSENILGFGLFAIGLILGGAVNLELMSKIPNSSEAVKFATNNLLNTVVGYMLLMFNPYFNDKMHAQSRALNYKILDGMVAILEKTPDKHQTQLIDPSTQAQLGEVYIAHNALEGRLQGVLGLMIQFCSFIGDSFFKARYILDDTSNENRMQDACDLMAGIFKTARLVFYPLRPEFSEIFDQYVFSTLAPTLRKHARTRGPEMFDRIMESIRSSRPAPSEYELKKYYEPFVAGALGLKRGEPSRDLFTEVNDLIEVRGPRDVSRRSLGRVLQDWMGAIDAASERFTESLLPSPALAAAAGMGPGMGPAEPWVEPLKREMDARNAAKLEEPVYRGDDDLKKLANEILDGLDGAVEAGAKSTWRKQKYRRALEQASPQMAKEVVKRLLPSVEGGRRITRAQVEEAAKAVVHDAMDAAPNLFSRRNTLGLTLFAAGLGLSTGVNVLVLDLLNAAPLEIKLAVQNLIGTVMGILMGVFNPFFNDKMHNNSKAINYKMLEWSMALVGGGRKEKQTESAVEAAVQARLEPVYTAQQELEGRIQGVLGLLNGFCCFIGESFFKARYILDDTDNPNRMEDACDLMAGIFVNARVNFYALRPEFKELFIEYVFSVLEPTLRKHSQVDGERMFEQIMGAIMKTSPKPSDETIKKYYEPFVRGALGLDTGASQDLLSEVHELMREHPVNRQP